jgi:hypothetical protein
MVNIREAVSTLFKRENISIITTEILERSDIKNFKDNDFFSILKDAESGFKQCVEYICSIVYKVGNTKKDNRSNSVLNDII